MRFFEYEARQIVRRAGIPTSAHGFARTPAEARGIAEEIGAPTVIKSQVLTGGRMKAGGVQFADTPEEAGTHAEAILGLALACEALAGYLERPDYPVDVRHFALGAAQEATATLETNNDLESSALVAQVRSTALDLLQAAGMGPAEALEAVRHPRESAGAGAAH